MIVDEAHRLKAGTRGKLFQALTGLNTNHRVLLTGTPLQVSQEAGNTKKQSVHSNSFYQPGFAVPRCL